MKVCKCSDKAMTLQGIFFQTEHNFALQIFVLGRVWGCVFFIIISA